MGGRRSLAWVLNLDAELEMAEPSYCPRARTLEQLKRYSQGARTLLGPEDVILDGTNLAALGRVGRAWCPTPRALARMQAAGVEPEPHPPVAVLHAVNHRKFAMDLALGLPGQCYIEDRTALDSLLVRGDRNWMLKRPLAFSGRGQQRILSEVDGKQNSWIDASLRRTGLVAEPLVTPSLELSLHGFVWQDKRYELGQVCVQDVSERGVFRGIRVMHEGELTPDEEQQFRDSAEQTAVALGGAGYFGPFGIDGYRYKMDDQVAFCALGEINARYTMGFVTGFPRHPSELSLE